MKRKSIVLLIALLFIVIAFNVNTYAKFYDLNGYGWAEVYINDYDSKGYISGTSKNMFSPGNNVRREEFVKLVITVFGYDTTNQECYFTDVSRNNWSYPYIATATNRGIISGVGNGKFGKGQYITREDICTILCRVLEDKGYGIRSVNDQLLTFYDRYQISGYAVESVTKLYNAGVINGVDVNHFAPQNYATRAQMVKIVYLTDLYKTRKTSGQENVKVTSIKLNKNMISLEKGKSETLTATISPSNATDKRITWESSNTNIARVVNGLVTGVSGGTAVITAKSQTGNVADTCLVTVTVPTIPVEETPIEVTSVALDKTILDLKVGKSITLNATVTPSNATNKTITWKSDNTNVASVVNGKVTAVNAGTTLIHATAQNDKTAVCVVNVSKPVAEVQPAGISLNITTMTINVGTEKTITATVYPNEAINKTITWTTSDSQVASVVNGKVTALKDGTAVISATTANGKTATCIVTVNKEPVEIQPTGIYLNNSQITLNVGESNTLIATVYPSTATNKIVSWTSSNSQIASVAKGKVTALKEGTAVISATTSNGKTATCIVTVNKKVTQVQPTGISLNLSKLTLTVGGTRTLTATITPSNVTIKTVTWKSSASAVAAVSNGKVTALKVGTTVISATTTNGKTATCIVTVNKQATQIQPTGISLNLSKLTLTVGGTRTLTATITPSNATVKTVAWKSSATSVATVVGGRVTALKAGTTVISATTTNGKTATCIVTVNNQTTQIQPTSVSLNLSRLTLNVGGTRTLTATITPSNATNKTLTWKSSVPSVASVVQGRITAIKAGMTTITVTTSNGKTASCVVTVKTASTR